MQHITSPHTYKKQKGEGAHTHTRNDAVPHFSTEVYSVGWLSGNFMRKLGNSKMVQSFMLCDFGMIRSSPHFSRLSRHRALIDSDTGKAYAFDFHLVTELVGDLSNFSSH